MIEKEIRELRKYVRRLEKTEFNMETQKDGTVKIRHGKKYIFLETPNKEWADMVMGCLHALFSAQIKHAVTFIETAENHCNQLKLDLFGGEDGTS